MAIGKASQSPNVASASRPREPEAKRPTASLEAGSPAKWAPAGKAKGTARPAPGAAPAAGSPQGTTAATTTSEVLPRRMQFRKDAIQLREMKDLMSQSATGAAAIKYLDDEKVPVMFANGGGSYWDGWKIVIDRNQSTQIAGLNLVHELNHAKAAKTGASGDIVKQKRDDYVCTMLNEEVTGQIASIKAMNELVAAGKPIAATFPLDEEYITASKSAVDALKASNPKATEAELKDAGEKAGFDRVMKGFKDGEVVMSTNYTKYPDYYGAAWDRKHP